MLFMLDSRMVLDHTSPVVHIINLSQVPTKSKQATTSGRSLDNQRQTSIAVVLGGLILPPMRQTWSRGERFRPNGYTTISAYWAYNHQHAISTLNTCLREPTHRSLTDTGGDYSLGGAGLPLTTR
jgi:hypothetical protein